MQHNEKYFVVSQKSLMGNQHANNDLNLIKEKSIKNFDFHGKEAIKFWTTMAFKVQGYFQYTQKKLTNYVFRMSCKKSIKSFMMKNF